MKFILGFNRDDGANFWDCKIDFGERNRNSIARLNTNIKIKTPFINLSKEKLLNLVNDNY